MLEASKPGLLPTAPHPAAAAGSASGFPVLLVVLLVVAALVLAAILISVRRRQSGGASTTEDAHGTGLSTPQVRFPSSTASDRPLLVIHGVSKSFGGVRAVSDITFDVHAGESIGLVGPNGAGKTTLFNCVCGQLRPEEGEITFDGDSLIGIPTFKRARLGIGRTYQKVEVFTDMTVRDHLLVAERARRGESRLWKDLLNQSKPTTEEIHNVEQTLELVGIGHLADTSVNALGLGNCRLVELARALAAQPKILLADEPSSGLDLHETAEVAAVLRTVQRERGTAVLLVEHDLSMVADVVDRTVVMDLGAKLCEGPFDVVMADPAVRQAYLGQMATSA